MEMPQDNQNDSLLLSKVPIEIRKMIFEQFFRSITMRHGLGTTSTTYTALLHSEASHLLALNISLHFRSTETMLDCLTILPSDTIKSLRHIRVRAFPFPINRTTYQMAHTLPMFLGLQLDLFEVEDCYHDPGENDPWSHCGTYFDVGSLIFNDGWKELHYISPTTEFMTGAFDEHQRRVAQPSGWREDLLNRDGGDSGATVEMFVANEPGVTRMAENPSSRTAYSAIPGHLSHERHQPNVISGPNFVMVEPASEEDIDRREVLVVVKRGKGVKYVQDGSRFYKKLQEVFRGKTWQEVKEIRGVYRNAEDDPCSHL